MGSGAAKPSLELQAGGGSLLEHVEAEAAKPLDASDLNSGDAAIEEVKRLRGLLRDALPALLQSESGGYQKAAPLFPRVPASQVVTQKNTKGMWMQPADAIREAQSRNASKIITEPLTEQRESAYKEAFNLLDVDSSGYITADNLMSVFRSLEQYPSEEEVKSMIDEVDITRDGVVGYKEFLILMDKQMTRVKAAAMSALVAARARKHMALFDVNPTNESMEMAKCEKCVSRSEGGIAKDMEDLSIKEDNFLFQPIFEHAVHVDVPYELQKDLEPGLETEALPSQHPQCRGQTALHVAPWVLRRIAERAITHIEHYLRPGHLAQLATILQDPEASDNDRFVAESLLRNAVISANGVLPGCQDTGTAICMGKKGQYCFTQNDEEHLSHGIFDAFTKRNLRYSQVSPVNMFSEKNTGNNLPAQFDLYSVNGNEFNLMFMAKGGGSANKTYLYQQTKALLNPKSLEAFIKEKVQTLGTSACPPYHLAVVIGGTSAELTLKTVKLASARYLDDLPQTGNASGRAYRDTAWEQKILTLCQGFGIGAQFGGKYFVHDVRVIRLPRHGASCPVGIGVSCSADRQILVKITPDGVFLEQLEKNPARFLPPEAPRAGPNDMTTVDIDLNQPMVKIIQTLDKYPIKTRLNLNGTIIVARDIAHAKLAERLEKEGSLPDYMSAHVIYYAGPAKTPKGYASGSFGPTTAGRMDSYVPLFMKHGTSLLTLAKGNRSKAVTDACKAYGGFYLGSIGGAAANLAEHAIKKVELVEYEELGMEAVWCIEVVDFPAFIIVDNKGNDFFSSWSM
jgi:fumarate hydratase class I